MQRGAIHVEQNLNIDTWSYFETIVNELGYQDVVRLYFKRLMVIEKKKRLTRTTFDDGLRNTFRLPNHRDSKFCYQE